MYLSPVFELKTHTLTSPQWRNWSNVRTSDSLLHKAALTVASSHDDITYQSIAKAYSLPLKLHEEALERMKRLSKPHKLQPDFDWDTDSPARAAKYRMLYLPTDDSRDLKEQFLFVSNELWVVCLLFSSS